MIDLTKLASSVQKRFVEFGVDHYTNVEQFKLSCGSAINTKEYNFNSMTFEINLDLEPVWATYLNSDPKSTWSGKNIQFDFAYSKPRNKVYYKNDELPPIHEGMGFYIVLNIAGLKKVPVGIEITRIDHDNKVLEYTYLMENVSHGKQIVHFRTDFAGKTIIEHNTYFKSDSNFRDQLYPIFHEKLLEEFHQNVMGQVGLQAKRIDP